jgi:hypothetical protein
MREYPRLISSRHYLSENDVLGVQLRAHCPKVTLITRQSQDMCIANDRKLSLTTTCELRNKSVSQPVGKWIERRVTCLVVETSDSDDRLRGASGMDAQTVAADESRRHKQEHDGRLRGNA